MSPSASSLPKKKDIVRANQTTNWELFLLRRLNNEYFRDEYCYDTYQSESTEEIKDKLFPNLKLEDVYDLLKELESEGKMRSVAFDQTIMATIDWRCNLF